MQFQFNERIKAGSSTLRPFYYNKGSVLMAERVHTSKGYGGSGLADSGDYAKSFRKDGELHADPRHREGTTVLLC